MVNSKAARNYEPILYRIAMDMQRRHYRGSTRFFKMLRAAGYLNRPVDFPLSDTIRVRVPIVRNMYDQVYIDGYEEDLFVALATEIRKLPGPVTLHDVGADIGLFSLKLLAHCSSIASIFAFEPNSEGFPWLEFNLSRLPKGIEGKAFTSAISDFQGQGRLGIPAAHFTPGVETNHTQFFLEPFANGPIAVKTIDCLNLPVTNSVVLKVDVEGGELPVLRGSARTIASVPNLIVVVEAHPAVARRTGIDPVECLRFLASIRPFRFVASETNFELQTDKAVFDQIKPDQIYNVIARSL